MTKQVPDGITVTTPNPADAGSGELASASLSRSPSPPTPPRARKCAWETIFRGLAKSSGILIVALIAAIGVFLPVAGGPALTRNRKTFTYGGNWITATSAMHRHLRPAAGDGVRLGLRAGAGDAGGARHRDLPHAVRRQASARPAGLPGGPAGCGASSSTACGACTCWHRCSNRWPCGQQEPGLAVPVQDRRARRRWPGNGGIIFTAGIVLAVMILPIITAVTAGVHRTPRAAGSSARGGGHPLGWCAPPCCRSACPATSVAPCSASVVRSARPSLLVILRGTQTAFRVVAVRRVATQLRQQDRGHRKQRPVQGGRLHIAWPGAVHPDLHRELTGPRRGLEGAPNDLHARAAVKAPVFRALVPARKLLTHRDGPGDGVGALVALVPLAWVLYSVVVKVSRRSSPVWFTNSQAEA